MTIDTPSKGEPEKTPFYVSADKAFELEVKFIGDEISRRMDYNRRTQNFQILIIAACLAGFLNKGSNFSDYALIEYVCALISLINTMFILEIRQNTFYQIEAAKYITTVINRKYLIKDSASMVATAAGQPMGWEDFLHRARTNHASPNQWLHRLSFVGSAHLIMSINLTVFPLLVYLKIIYDGDVEHIHFIALYILVYTATFNTTLIMAYIFDGYDLNKDDDFSAPSLKGNRNIILIRAKDADFDYFYELRHTTMLEHFTQAGKVWDHNERMLHRANFNPKTLWIINYRGQRVGFVNVPFHGSDLGINFFCIEPDHQNKGIGTKVMLLIIAKANREKRRIFLDVLKANKAYRLYERLGFERIEGDNAILLYYRYTPKLNCWTRIRARLTHIRSR